MNAIALGQASLFQQLYLVAAVLCLVAALVFAVSTVAGIFLVNPTFDPDWRHRWHAGMSINPLFAALRTLNYSGAVFAKWIQRRAFQDATYDFRGRASTSIYLLCIVIQLTGFFLMGAIPVLGIVHLFFEDLL